MWKYYSLFKLQIIYVANYLFCAVYLVCLFNDICVVYMSVLLRWTKCLFVRLDNIHARSWDWNLIHPTLLNRLKYTWSMCSGLNNVQCSYDLTHCDVRNKRIQRFLFLVLKKHHANCWLTLPPPRPKAYPCWNNFNKL